jgi:hypothetical protein
VVLAGNVVNALAMFNWRGDVVWVNTVPYAPVLDFVSGGLFLLGVTWCVSSLIQTREPVWAYLLVSLFVLMLPSMLSISFPGENPSVVRTGGAGPVAALLVAIPLHAGIGWGMRTLSGPALKLVVPLVAVLLMGLATAASYQRYFVEYPTQYRYWAVNVSEMAGVIDGFARSIGSYENAYVKHSPDWLFQDMKNVGFEIGQPDWDNVLFTTGEVLSHRTQMGNKLYIIHKDDEEAVRAFQQRFPEGQLRTQASATPGKEFLVFFVPDPEAEGPK